MLAVPAPALAVHYHRGSASAAGHSNTPRPEGHRIVREHRKPPPNDLLRHARLRILSPSGSGRPMSRQELADAVNAHLSRADPSEASLDANHIGKLERGEHRWPNGVRRAAFRHVLRVSSDRDLGFYIVRGMSLSQPTRTVEPTSADADDHRPGRSGTADLQRRALLRGVAAVATSAGLLGPPVGQRRRLGHSDIERLDAVTAMYRSLDYECGGGLLYAHLNAFAESVAGLVDHDYSDRLRPALLTAIAGARQLAGWTAFDAGHHVDAQRHWLAAERAAVEADDVPLAARIRYCQARQFQHLRHNRDALDTLHLAGASLGDAATPAISAMLQGAEAASRAALGDASGALRALASADGWFACVEPDREPVWMRFYDRGELFAQYGRVYRDLARTDPRRHGETAVQWVTDAIAAFGPQNVRSTVLNEVGLCSAWSLAGQPDQALAVGRVVIERAAQLTSARVSERIRNLSRDLAPHSDRSDVADFSRHLTTVGTATTP